MERLELKEYAGQNTTVAINKRDDGSVYVEFRMREGYGYPVLEFKQLKELIKKCKLLGGDVNA